MDIRMIEIIENVSKTKGIDKEAVKAALYVTTNWTRNKMITMEYPAILWPRLGSFSVIPSRCPEESKTELKEFKNTFKK